ncbi:unnamed protein product, partial [Polarella glacialis]
MAPVTKQLLTAPAPSGPGLSELLGRFKKPLHDAALWENVDTVTLKNIPCRCRREEILGALADLGFGKETLTYFHLPIKQGKGSFNLGYCFVGFKTPELAATFHDRSIGFKFQSRQSDKVVTVEPAKVQYRNDPGYTPMHGDVVYFEERAQSNAVFGAVNNSNE